MKLLQTNYYGRLCHLANVSVSELSDNFILYILINMGKNANIIKNDLMPKIKKYHFTSSHRTHVPNIMFYARLMLCHIYVHIYVLYVRQYLCKISK